MSLLSPHVMYYCTVLLYMTPANSNNNRVQWISKRMYKTIISLSKRLCKPMKPTVTKKTRDGKGSCRKISKSPPATTRGGSKSCLFIRLSRDSSWVMVEGTRLPADVEVEARDAKKSESRAGQRWGRSNEDIHEWRRNIAWQPVDTLCCKIQNKSYRPPEPELHDGLGFPFPSLPLPSVSFHKSSDNTIKLSRIPLGQGKADSPTHYVFQTLADNRPWPKQNAGEGSYTRCIHIK